ncbi:MAG TPA: alpha/beta hydrolase-fold protein, partial [Flavisolibacter sp.]
MPFYFKRAVVVIVFICLAGGFLAAQSRIDDLNLNGRKVSVYSPAGLKKNKKYPVLVFTDGQHCFGKGFHSLGLDILADSLIKQRLMEPVIILAIHSDHNRLNDYIPYLDSSIFNDFGYYQPRSIELIGFIKDELLPLIRSKYPANDTTGIAGFSFGGLLASWAALHYPETFSFSAAFSPSMWVCDYRIFKEASLADSSQVYYLDIGTAEWN